MGKYFRLLIVILLFGSCTKEGIGSEYSLPIMELDARLPIDSNGYYHLVLNQNSNQTIHRITGKVENITEPTKVYWDSNLVWYFNGEEVPTINSVTYIGDMGEIDTVIAPIFGMRNDTLIVKATINEWKIIQTLNIVLD